MFYASSRAKYYKEDCTIRKFLKNVILSYTEKIFCRDFLLLTLSRVATGNKY